MFITTVYLFVLMMVEPDGSLVTMTKQVPQCPPTDMVESIYAPMKESGAVLDWSAVCIKGHLEGLLPKENI